MKFSFVTTIAIFFLTAALSTATYGAYLEKSFDHAVDKLPPNFEGHDIKKIWLQPNNVAPRQDTFEKTDAYVKRLNSYYENIADDNYVYAFRLFEPSTIALTYDADREIFRIQIKIQPYDAGCLGEDGIDVDVCNMLKNVELNMKGQYYLIVKSDIEKSYYEGQNAFGAKRNIKKYSGISYNLALTSNSDIVIGFLSEDISFKAAPDRAKALSGAMGILAICRLSLPYNAKHLFFLTPSLIWKKATFTDPEEISILGFNTHAQLMELWVYNISTGEIILKKKVADRIKALEQATAEKARDVQQKAEEAEAQTQDRVGKWYVADKKPVTVYKELLDGFIYYAPDKQIMVSPGEAFFINSFIPNGRYDCYRVTLKSGVKGYISVRDFLSDMEKSNISETSE